MTAPRADRPHRLTQGQLAILTKLPSVPAAGTAAGESAQAQLPAPSATPPTVDNFISISAQSLLLVGVVGRLRRVMGGRVRGITLPNAVLGVEQAVKISDNISAKHARFVSVQAGVGSPVVIVSFARDADPAVESGQPVALTPGGDPFEQILLPGEALYAVNLGVVAARALVAEVEVVL